MDIKQRIKTELAASAVAAAAGNTEAADKHWRTYVGLMELDMGRRSSPAAPLTPNPNPETR